MTDHELRDRLDRLERKCRRLTLAAGGLGIALVAGVTMAMAPVQEDAEEVPDLIRARAFQVVDDDGNVRIALQERSTFGTSLRATPEGGYEIVLTAAKEENDHPDRWVVTLGVKDDPHSASLAIRPPKPTAPRAVGCPRLHARIPPSP